MDISEKNYLLIEFEYNGREIDGIDEFKTELQEHYLIVQGRSKHVASFSEGGEFWLTAFINSPIGEFLAQNVAWDLFKYGLRKMFLKPLFDALNNLEKANAKTYKLRVKKLKLQFDDTHVYIGGINGNFMSIVGAVFQNLTKNIGAFEDEAGKPIASIELPIYYDDKIDNPRFSKYRLDTSHGESDVTYYLNLWRINGVNCAIYNHGTKAFLPC